MLLAARCAPCRLVAKQRPCHLAMQSTCACSERLQGAQALSEPPSLAQAAADACHLSHTLLAAVRLRSWSEGSEMQERLVFPCVVATVAPGGVGQTPCWHGIQPGCAALQIAIEGSEGSAAADSYVLTLQVRERPAQSTDVMVEWPAEWKQGPGKLRFPWLGAAIPGMEVSRVVCGGAVLPPRPVLLREHTRCRAALPDVSQAAVSRSMPCAWKSNGKVTCIAVTSRHLHTS